MSKALANRAAGTVAGSVDAVAGSAGGMAGSAGGGRVSGRCGRVSGRGASEINTSIATAATKYFRHRWLKGKKQRVTVTVPCVACLGPTVAASATAVMVLLRPLHFPGRRGPPLAACDDRQVGGYDLTSRPTGRGPGLPRVASAPKRAGVRQSPENAVSFPNLFKMPVFCKMCTSAHVAEVTGPEWCGGPSVPRRGKGTRTHARTHTPSPTQGTVQRRLAHRSLSLQCSMPSAGACAKVTSS